jgi:hypothetical protein
MMKSWRTVLATALILGLVTCPVAIQADDEEDAKGESGTRHDITGEHTQEGMRKEMKAEKARSGEGASREHPHNGHDAHEHADEEMEEGSH